MGEKEQRTNEQYGLGLTQVQEGGSVTLHSQCIRRQTLTCILCKISTKPRGMLTHLWRSSSLLTVVDCPSAFPFTNYLLWVPFSNKSHWRSLAHFRSCRDLELRLFFFGFELKQAKRSSAWCTLFIMSQQNDQTKLGRKGNPLKIVQEIETWSHNEMLYSQIRIHPREWHP